MATITVLFINSQFTRLAHPSLFSVSHLRIDSGSLSLMSSNKNEKGAAQLTKYQTIEDTMLGKTPSTVPHYKDDSLFDERMPWYLIATFVITMLSLTLWFWMDERHPPTVLAADNSQAFDSFGRYVMYNYDEAKPMADFLPALGGIWGYPMWYVVFFIVLVVSNF